MSNEGQLGPNARLIGQKGSRKELATPALLLDLDALEHNISAMAKHCRDNNLNLRPHTKTHKSVRIAKMQLDAGAIGICVATLREAAVMVGAGLSGVHVTSPMVGQVKIDGLVALVGQSKGLSVVVDNLENAKQLEATLRSRQQSLSVLIDVDRGAMFRTGVQSTEDAIALARYAVSSDVLKYAGIQFYSGIVQHITTPEERKVFYGRQLEGLAELVEQLDQNDLKPQIVSGGGSGTFDIDAGSGVMTENQAGSYVVLDVEYGDVNFLSDAAHPFKTALFVQTTVVSNNAAGIVTTDAGPKSLATDGPMPRIATGAPAGSSYQYFGDEFGMVMFEQETKMPESREEFQAMAEGAQPHELFYSFFPNLKGQAGQLEVGAKIELITPHCDPTVNLHNYYHCVRGDTLVDIWPVDARGSL